MININDVQCPYRDYGDMIICYSKPFHNHFVLENVYADFFRYFYVFKKTTADTVEIISKEYGVTIEQVYADFKEFLREITMRFLIEESFDGPKLSSDDMVSQDSIYNYMAKAVLPFSATIEIIDRCNLNCVHCYRGEPQKTYWNIQTWSRVLDELKSLGTLHLTITGGEPFAHPDIIEMLEIANEKGFVISIQTNATYELDRAIPVLKNSTIEAVFVSLYSMSARVHDFITNQPGSLAKTKKNIETLMSCGVPVTVNCPVMVHNRDDMVQVKSFCDNLGIKCNFAFKIIPSQQEDKQTLSLNCFSSSFLNECIHDPNIRLYENELKSIRKAVANDRYCQTGFRSITFDAQGNVLLCNAFRKNCGNVQKQSVSDIWKLSKELNEWRDIKSRVNSKCQQCKAYPYCEPCPAHAYTLTGSDKDIDELSCSFGKALYDADNQHSTQG